MHAGLHQRIQDNQKGRVTSAIHRRQRSQSRCGRLLASIWVNAYAAFVIEGVFFSGK